VPNAFTRARERRPFLDHLVRMFQRYQADTGDRMAAAVTYFWFLSLFPILLLAVSLLGYVLDEPQKTVSDALEGVLPANAAATIADILNNAKGSAGVIGLVGLLYSGLGWINALRESLRMMWHQNVQAGNFFRQKLFDVVALIGLLAVIGASVVLTGLVSTATSFVLEHVGLGENNVAGRVLVRVVGITLLVLADTVLFLYLLIRLPRVRTPIKRVVKGAVFGAVGFEILKFLGSYYVARTTSKGAATYGAFAVVVGLLLFLNLVSRLILFTAAFVVTAPYDSDVAPSGTADAEQARKAGIPVEFADSDPDDPPNLSEDGAPSPLVNALQGRTPPQDEPEGRESSRRGATGGPATGADAPRGRSGEPTAQTGEPTARPAGPVDRTTATATQPLPGRQPLPGQQGVLASARVIAGAGVLAVAGVLWYAVRTLRHVVRR
jgi:membrane protein